MQKVGGRGLGIGWPSVSAMTFSAETSFYNLSRYFQVEGSLGSGIHGFRAQIRSKSSRNWFDNSSSAATKRPYTDVWGLFSWRVAGRRGLGTVDSFLHMCSRLFKFVFNMHKRARV